MAKEVKVLELTQEQIQNMLLEQQKNSDTAEQQQQEAIAIEQAILQMSPEEITDYISDHLTHTNVIVEALNITDEFSFQEAIFIASLNRSRLGLDAAISWIENHFSLNEVQAEETEIENKTKSPKRQKDGKRIVYGTSENLASEDDSEQL